MLKKLERGKVMLKNAYPSKQLLRLWNEGNRNNLLPLLLLLLLLFILLLFSTQITVGGEEDKKLLDQLERTVFDLCNGAQDFYHNFPTFDQRECVYYDTCDSQLERRIPFFECVQGFGSGGECRCQGEKLSLKYPVTLYSPHISRNQPQLKIVECMANSIRSTFISNMQKFPIIKRQIFTSPKGVSQIYPGYKWRFVPPETPISCKLNEPPKDCPGFDPRTRGWYMGTASTSKSIILILDVSSSMGDSHRLENAIYATRTVINYLTEKDYVGIVMFNAMAFTCKKQTDVLLKATPSNKKILLDCIENMMPFGSTNFEAAFNETFNLFDRSEQITNSTCDRVVLFLTDGTITKGGDPIPLIRERNDEYNAKIFSFSLGSLADIEIPKNIACENRGLWSVIEDKRIQDLNTHMSSYYEYLSARYEERDATWVGPFDDVTGLGGVVTVSASCSTSTGRFLGVALAAISAQYIANLTEFKDRSKRFSCPKAIPDEYLQMLRIEEGKSCNYCGFCKDDDSNLWISIGVPTSIFILISFLLILIIIWIGRKIYIRRKKWKMRKNFVNTNFRHSNSWIDLNSSKRKLEKVRLPAQLGGEDLELNTDYSSFRNI